ncbi:hypothetical protein H0H93_010996 [Arthromyces matolae]|nr:hypothetical protein H0H93_010996 [Arthromyces matolae]
MAFAWSGVCKVYNYLSAGLISPSQATDIPWGHFDFSTRKPEVATLTLEWYTLSQYAVNDTYRQLAEGAARRIASQSAPLPGLPAQGIDPSSGKSVGGYVTWGGGSDSYFEYLIKYARLNPDADDLFTDNWRLAVDSSIATLLKISSVGKHAYFADYDGSKQIRHVGSHLACFYGGNLIFGGRILNNDTIVNVGLQLTDACWNTYASTATGIGPEVFAFTSDDGGYTGGDVPTAEQSAFNALHGFYITSADYILRPEVLESNFYAWRATGDTKYVARAASALKSFDQYLSTNGAYAGIWDVNDNNVSDDQNRINDMENVFNTEAHPFKLSAPKSQYGSGAQPTPAATSTFKMNQGQTPEVSQIAGMPSIKDSIQGVISKVGQTVLQ